MTAVPAPGVARPADGLLHPVVLIALLVLVVNDQLAKHAWPGFVTGKVSDIAGLVVAPIALQAAWETGLWLTRRWRGPSERALLVAIAVVGVVFAASQVWPPAIDAYRWGLATLQWPIRAAVAAASGAPLAVIVPVAATPDAEDLVAMPALAVTWWVGRGRARGPEPPPVGG